MPQKKKTKTCFYGRVSTKSESQLSSFENQPEELKRILMFSKDNYELVDMYLDWGTSGTKLKRPRFDDMLYDAGIDFTIVDAPPIPSKTVEGIFLKQRKYVCTVATNRKPKFEEIWVKSTSRFARNINVYDIITTLKQAGVYTVFKSAYQSLSTRNSKDLATIRERLNQDMTYSENLSFDMRAYKEQSIRENRLPHSAPYGYNYHKKTKGKLNYYTINKAQADVVRRIFDLSINGYGNNSIGKQLAKEGHFTVAGKPFASTTISSILKNEKYMGLNNRGKYSTGELFDKFSSPMIDPNYTQHLAPSENLPAIITKEVWDATRQAIASRRQPDKTGGIHLPTHPFKDLLVCGYCGNHFTYDNNSGRGYFTCATKNNKGAEMCNCNNLYMYKLDEYIEKLCNGELYTILTTDCNFTLITLITIIEAYINNLKNPNSEQEMAQNLSTLTSALAAKKRAREVLLDMLSSDNFDPTDDTYGPRLKDIEIDILALNKSIDDLTKPAMDLSDKIKVHFKAAFDTLSIFENKKEVYSSDEVLCKLSKILVYGRTENNLGGKPPRTILMPIINSLELSQELARIGMGTFHYKFRNYLPDYYTPEQGKPLHPADDDSIPKDMRFNHTTKRHWKSGDSKYMFQNNAYTSETGELGYIPTLGVEGVTELQQIKEKLNSLLEDFNSIQ
ncbi:MAG: recombinase family protein [Anaerovoracaceae bacterium]